MIVYAWPITLSLDLVATWHLGATASGFFLSWDQIGNVPRASFGILFHLLFLQGQATSKPKTLHPAPSTLSPTL